jgi:hypothetical protein
MNGHIYIYVLEVSTLPLSTILIFDFRIVRTVWDFLFFILSKPMVLCSIIENTEGAIKNGQSRETDNIGYTRRRQTKQRHNTMRVKTPHKQIQ